jgi:Icc-related predicted phosphoesterase
MALRIIAFTDIHGAYGKVEEMLVGETRFDAVIVGGDLTTMGTPDEAEGALRRFGQHGAPLLVVAGNMDPPGLEDVFTKHNVSINGKGVTIHDVGIFGVSGAPFSQLHTPNEISEKAIQELAERGWNQVKLVRWKIFVPHAPPFDTKVDLVYSGRHVGSTAVRRFIEQYQPDLALCGHIHEARGEDRIGRTRVFNCGAAGRGHYVTVELNETLVVSMH